MSSAFTAKSYICTWQDCQIVYFNTKNDSFDNFFNTRVCPWASGLLCLHIHRCLKPFLVIFTSRGGGRLGEFTSNGRLFTIDSILKITEVAHILFHFFHKHRLCSNFDKKLDWDRFWAIFSQTHLVTLFTGYPGLSLRVWTRGTGLRL
jgi:hypothetical protein